MRAGPRRIVIVKPCCLGDGLMASAAVAALNQRYPDAVLHVAVGGWTRPAFATNPRVYAMLDTGALLGGRRPSLRLVRRLVLALRRGRYDTAVILERSFWVGLLPMLARITTRVGLDSRGRGLIHTHRVPVPHVRHEAALYLDCAAALDARTANPRMEFPLSAEARAAARALVRQPYALLHPGGGANPGMKLLTKRWPPTRFAEVARRLAGRGIHPVIAAGAADRHVAQAVARESGPVATALPPELSLEHLGALAAEARVYVGNDTGPTHLAVAVGAPTVAIFGPSDERRYGPFGRHDDGTPIGEAVASPLLAADAPTPPWLDRPVEAVSVDQVWEAVERALERAPAA